MLCIFIYLCPFYRLDSEHADRMDKEGGLNTRIDTEITDRENAISELRDRLDQSNANRDAELDDLKKKLMRENLFLKSLAGKPLSVYFDAYRTKAYDGGGEQNLTFQVHIALCSRNFQNVKLRLDFVEIWSSYRHSDFMWNQIFWQFWRL